MKYLVTGGCGFIGSHLCDALIARGDQVIVLDDLSTGTINYLDVSAQLEVGCVTDHDLVHKLMRDVDGCFHLAAIASVEQSQADWSGCHRINQGATINILSAAQSVNAKPVPVVYASSAAVYGDNASMPLEESVVARPISAYGADKLGCELHARVANLLHQVPTLGLRFFNVYGPRQNPRSPYSGVISIFADRLMRGETLSVFGDGQQARDFIYISDIVAMLLRGADLITQSKGHCVLNACTGEATNLLQLIRTLAAVTGKSPDIEKEPPRPGDIRTSLGSPERLINTLGYTASTSLGQGLKAMLEDNKQHSAADLLLKKQA